MNDLLHIPLCTPVGTEGACNTERHLDGEGKCKLDNSVSAGKRPLETDWPHKGRTKVWNGNAGILVGREQGIVCIEVDSTEEKNRYLSWNLPDTFTVRSGKGFHYYFLWPEGHNLPGRHSNILIRGSERTEQMVAPGSLHWSGKTYRVHLDVPMTALPAEFLTKVAATPSGSGIKLGFGPLDEKLTQGTRTNAVASLAGTMRRRDIPISTALVAARALNEQQCEPPLGEAKVDDTVRGIYSRFEPEVREEVSAEDKTSSESFYVDWSTFWDDSEDGGEWVYEPILARGRGHVIYATHKTGKSLLLLYVAARLATASEKVVVIYLDYENTKADIRDRLSDMGYSRDVVMDRLLYSMLPRLAPFDTREGAVEVLRKVDEAQEQFPDHHVVLCIDTFGRAVKGPEDKADTTRDFYRQTGMELKRRGVTWARLDHKGKDDDRSMRGSSGKGDDVDVVWELKKSDSGLLLKLDCARMRWVPEKVALNITQDPLNFIEAKSPWPEGTRELAWKLDNANVPLTASRYMAKQMGIKARNTLLDAALRFRRQEPIVLKQDKQDGNHLFENESGTEAGTTGDQWV